MGRRSAWGNGLPTRSLGFRGRGNTYEEDEDEDIKSQSIGYSILMGAKLFEIDERHLQIH